MLNGVSTMKIDLLNRAQLSIINKNNFRYPLAIAEKDYFLAVVLKIIYSSFLKEKLVFKGGTALNHLYLDQLRFSEDLDFTATSKVNIEEVKQVFDGYDFIDLAGDIILPPKKIGYKNVYDVNVKVLGMDIAEICTEKLRAINERARYRDFFDLGMAFKENDFEPKEILKILEQKELRKTLSSKSILSNLEIAEEARMSGTENLYYRIDIGTEEVKAAINDLLKYIDSK